MNRTLLAGAIFGASSVLLGAYGAHGLSGLLNKYPRMEIAYQNAVDYQMLHSVLLIILGVFSYIPKVRVPKFLAIILCASILLFSFTIYGWVMGGPNWLIKLTPAGGVGFVISWLLFIHLAWLNRGLK